MAIKFTKSKPVKSSPAKKSEKAAQFGDRNVRKPAPKPAPKGKPRILGTGTYQLKKHSPRVV
jgi:hypothetical protein